MRRSTLFLSFASLLLLGILSLIVTHSELPSIDRSLYADVERRREELDQTKIIALHASGPNIGRNLATYDTDTESQSDKESHDAATATHSASDRTVTSPQYLRITEENGKTSLSLDQRQLERSFPDSLSSHRKLETLFRIKRTELRMGTANNELWLYLRDQLNAMNFSEAVTAPELVKTELLHSVKEQLDVLSYHTSSMQSIVDSLIDEGWREAMSAELSRLMQRRLHNLQNPQNCYETKKLLCWISKPCGFGCQMHHIVYCFIFAYATQRMLVLDSSTWRYASNWETVFEPVTKSSNCSQDLLEPAKAKHWTSYADEIPPQTIKLPSIDKLDSNRPSFLPMAVPSDIIGRLRTFHGYPFVWFVGQFLHYLMRPSQHLRQYMNEWRAQFNFSRPIVGVHIRRTDKLRKEASYHSLEEYMIQVEEWYKWRKTALHIGEEEKRVYLATDDQTVLRDAIQMYPNYVFISDQEVSKTAGDPRSRYSKAGLLGVVTDVITLSECDYIVCTFSSQVCRLAYELMQQHHTDASRLAYSLDDVYYFGGQQEHHVRSFHHHTKQGQQSLGVSEGDVIKIAGNHHNGFSLGSKKGHSFRGLFPSSIVEEETVVADFPSYPEVL